MSVVDEFNRLNIWEHTYTIWFGVPNSQNYNGYYVLGITDDGKFLYTEMRFYCDTIRRTFYKYEGKSDLTGAFLFEQTLQDFLAYMTLRKLTGDQLSSCPEISDYSYAMDIFNELNKIIKDRCENSIADN